MTIASFVLDVQKQVFTIDSECNRPEFSRNSNLNIPRAQLKGRTQLIGINQRVCPKDSPSSDFPRIRGDRVTVKMDVV